MKIGIFTYGTRGDVQPYIALSLALKNKGHQVLLAAPENFRAMVESFDIEFHPLYGNAELMMHAHEGKKIIKTENTIQLMKYFFKVLSDIKWPLRLSYEDAILQVELVIANAATLPIIGALIEKYKLPLALTYFMPPIVETAAFPLSDFDFFNWSWYNKMTYRMAHYFYWQFVKADTNEYRSHLGMKPLKINLVKHIDKMKPLDLYCISPSLIPQPDDWASHHKITGFIHLPNHDKYKTATIEIIPHPLLHWLQKGEKPIYMGFGSNGIGNESKFIKSINFILDNSNERILFCKGWSGLLHFPTNERLFVIDAVDHESVFPYCKLGIFHGGAGTLATLLRHSLPMVIISFYTDQPTWGKIIVAKKLGLHIPIKKLMPSKLLDAIQEVQQPLYAENVSRMSKKIISEDGLQAAMNAIESYFNIKPN